MIGIKCELQERATAIKKLHKNVSKLMSVHQFIAVLIVT